jgi:hypothetical protein
MKTIILIYLMLIIPWVVICQSPAEQLVYKGKFVEIYVEKAIYHTISNENFMMKFIIKNTSDKNIGADLSDYWKVIYPNQWCIYQKPYREVIDERRIIPDKIINKTAIIQSFKNNKLDTISPGGSFEYYRDWNGSGEKADLKNKNEYLIISIDGQLLVTDGKSVEQITLTDAKEEDRVIVINYPIPHFDVPENAAIVSKKIK